MEGEAVPAVTAKKGSYKTTIIITIIVIVLIMIIAAYFYYQGKKTTTIAKVPVDNPDGTNNPSGVGDGVISQISGDLHSDMNGWNILGHNVTPYQQLVALSDTDFVRVYNLFNTNYEPASKETLIGWINDEDFWNKDVQNSILERAARLDLK
jgi:hypothetical protein